MRRHTAATDWLPHTTRAALTGLRKRGYAVLMSREAKSTRYRLAASTAVIAPNDSRPVLDGADYGRGEGDDGKANDDLESVVEEQPRIVDAPRRAGRSRVRATA
jgi:hypothetical protein